MYVVQRYSRQTDRWEPLSAHDSHGDALIALRRFARRGVTPTASGWRPGMLTAAPPALPPHDVDEERMPTSMEAELLRIFDFPAAPPFGRDPQPSVPSARPPGGGGGGGLTPFPSLGWLFGGGSRRRPTRKPDRVRPTVETTTGPALPPHQAPPTGPRALPPVRGRGR